MVPIFVPSSFSIMKRAASVRIDSWEGLSKSLRRSVFDFCGVMGSYSPLKPRLLKHPVRKSMSSFPDPQVHMFAFKQCPSPFVTLSASALLLFLMSV